MEGHTGDQDLARFFDARFPALEEGQTIEIRAFPATGGGRRYQEFFSDPEEAAAFVATLPAGIEIYYGVNARLGRGGKKADVAEASCLWSDIDDKHFDGDPQASEEAAFTLDLPPSYMARSGNGWQAYWQLDEPTDDLDRVERACRRLALALGGMDAVQDASRIFRVPGTWNNKDPRLPKRVTLEVDTGRTYSLEALEAMLPALPAGTVSHREVTEALGEGQRPSLDLLREVYAFIDPTVPYAEYIPLWGAVALHYPGEEGLAFVDEWSSDAREANGQTCSPRTQPQKHYSFKRQTGRVATMGTVMYYARKGGWKPPERPMILPTTGKRRKKMREEEYQERIEALPNPSYHDLPYYLRRAYDLLGGLTELLDRDFITQMAVTGWSQFFPGWRVENLPLSLWSLGVAGSGTGKNVITDALRELYTMVPRHAALYTSGSPEGILRALDGDKRALFIYLDEFADFLQALGKDYMSGTAGMLCSLHDGRPVAHRLTKQSLLITNPFASLVATTTPAKLVNHLREEDLDGGLASRFWVTLPKMRNQRVVYDIDPAARKELAEEMGQHVLDLGQFSRAAFYTPVPDELVTLERELGIGGEGWRTFEEELSEPRIARGRHVSRWKVQAALMESMKQRPAVKDGMLLITEESCQLALALARRSSVDQDRLVLRLGGSDDSRALDQIRRAIEKRPEGLTRSDLLRGTRVRAQDLTRLLQVLADSRELSEEEDGGGRTIYAALGGRPMRREGRA